uniref:C-type lectin 3 n=1 Tax=Agkistrodon contortrix contortrix TaxID=8713 RepID=A0A1W7RJZ6_AGKCO
MGRFIFMSFGLLVVFLSLCGTAADCPSGWSSYEGHCYKLFIQKFQWAHAEKFCTLQHTGSHLVSFHSSEEVDFVAALIYPNVKASFIWMGLSNIWNECNWQWSDGARLDYKAWSEQSDCIGFRTNFRQGYITEWLSTSCYLTNYVLCKFQA